MSDNERWYIIGRTYDQFKLFCRSHGKRVTECTFVDSHEKIRGIRKDIMLIFLPGFRENVSMWWQSPNRVWTELGRFTNKKYAEMDPDIPFVPYEVP